GFGALLSVPATFALTWALGRVSLEYFGNPKISREELKKVFSDAVQEGKNAFSKEAFDRFRQKNKDTKAPPIDEEEEDEKVEREVEKPPPEPKKPSDGGKSKKRTL